MREAGDSLQPSVDFPDTPDVGAHGPWLERAARGLGFAPADAEDLAQAVAATFLEIESRFEGRASLRTFLFGILRRKAAELRRGQKRATAREDVLQQVAAEQETDTHAEAGELGRVLHDCISDLPPKQRGVVELTFLHERKTDDAGRELGITANYLGVLLHRARAHLRDCMGAHGFER